MFINIYYIDISDTFPRLLFTHIDNIIYRNIIFKSVYLSATCYTFYARMNVTYYFIV